MSWRNIGTVLVLVASLAWNNIAHGEGTVLFILDGSGSMAQRLGEETKISAAKRTFSEMLGELPPGTHVGLEVYGHEGDRDCSVIEVMHPIGRLDAAAMSASVQELSPYRGGTPLAAAIRQGGELLAEAGGDASMVVISDGKETCDGDPVAAARELRERGIGVTVHVVGFGVDADERAQLEAVAEAGGGGYHDAESADALAMSFAELQKTLVEGASGDVVFEDAFQRDELGDDWKMVAEQPDAWLMDDYPILLTGEARWEETDGGGSFLKGPNLLELQEPLPEDFEITVTFEVDFQDGRFWGQEVGMFVTNDDAAARLAYRYGDFGSAGSRWYLGRLLSKHLQSGNEERIPVKEQVGRSAGVRIFHLRLKKTRFDIAAYARDDDADEWTELGSLKLLRFQEPRLQLYGRKYGGGPETTALVRKVEVRSVE